MQTEAPSSTTTARRMLLADADPWLTKAQTAAHRGVSTATLDRMIRRGLFPSGEWLSPGRRGWRLSVIEAAPSAPRGNFAAQPKARTRRRRADA